MNYDAPKIFISTKMWEQKFVLRSFKLKENVSTYVLETFGEFTISYICIIRALLHDTHKI